MILLYIRLLYNRSVVYSRPKLGMPVNREIDKIPLQFDLSVKISFTDKLGLSKSEAINAHVAPDFESHILHRGKGRER